MGMRLLRILFGFLLGCLGAGITMVLFVLTPAELAGLPPDVAGDRIAKGLELATFVAIQIAIFSAPLALVGICLGEFLRNREWTFYVIAALVVTGVGFLVHRTAESIGQPTIANNYAFVAFLTAGFVAGITYWLISGRMAGPGDPPLKQLPPPPAQTGEPAAPATKAGPVPTS